MVIVTRLSFVPVGLVCVTLAIAPAGWAAEEPASALSSFQQTAARHESEWLTLTTNLEQRLARLLPCDPRIRAAIEETSRASDARVTALTTYWMAVAGKSKNQTEAIRRLFANEEARKGEWSKDRAEADQEHAKVIEQNGFLAIGVGRTPALAEAQKALTAATQSMLKVEAQIQERQTSGEKLAGALREMLTASDARQNAIETQLRSISLEGSRWTVYYAARIARAQTECAITNPGEAADPPPRKPAVKKGPAK